LLNADALRQRPAATSAARLKSLFMHFSLTV
jgi:hypothetical protein